MTSNAGGTIAGPQLNKWMRRQKSHSTFFGKVAKQFQLYCENSSLNGCKYFTEPGRHWVERLIWILMYVFMSCYLIFVISDVLLEYKMSPIVPFPDEQSYSVINIPFPGVAVCTLNRMSYKSVRELAETIHSSHVANISLGEIVGLLRYLGHLYDYSYSGYKMFKAKQRKLHELLTQFHEGAYDADFIMKSLTPKCPELILDCNYASQEVKCMDIFTFRKTQEGYCCTFNYIRNFDESATVNEGDRNKNDNRKALRSHGPGIANGLSMLIEPLLHDYFYTKASSRGWKIIIFRPEDYPDNLAGGALEQMIAPSTETYLRLDAIAFSTPEELIKYPIGKRKCIFHSLKPQPRKNILKEYTYADCIVDCRLEDIWQTCRCIPFFYPITNHRRICDLSDIHCISVNKVRWANPFAQDNLTEVLDLDLNSKESMSFGSEIGIDCSQWLPKCNDVRYFVKNSVTTLTPGIPLPNLATNYSMKEQSIVHVYFGTYGVRRLQQDVIYYWYELLSNIGGICGVFMGFSLVSVIEVLYFIVSPIWTGFGRREEMNFGIEKMRGNCNTLDVQLYWAELQPRRGRNLNVKRSESPKQQRISTTNQEVEIQNLDAPTVEF